MIKGYDAEKYEYWVVVAPKDWNGTEAGAYFTTESSLIDGDGKDVVISYNKGATVQTGKISFQGVSAKLAGVEPGSELYVYVLKRPKDVNVNVYPLANNVVLVTAKSASNDQLSYNNNPLVRDDRYGSVGGYTQVMLLDAARLKADLGTVTMDNVKNALTSKTAYYGKYYNKFSMNDWNENYNTTASVVASTRKINVSGLYDINLSGGAPDVTDIAMVYNIYKGSYSYASDAFGLINLRYYQHLLSDVTFSDSYNASNSDPKAGTLDTGINANSSTTASATLYNTSDGASQLVNMEDVRAEYKAAYGTN